MKIIENLQILWPNIWTQLEKKLTFCGPYLWTAGVKWW